MQIFINMLVVNPGDGSPTHQTVESRAPITVISPGLRVRLVDPRRVHLISTGAICLITSPGTGHLGQAILFHVSRGHWLNHPRFIPGHQQRSAKARQLVLLQASHRQRTPRRPGHCQRAWRSPATRFTLRFETILRQEFYRQGKPALVLVRTIDLIHKSLHALLQPSLESPPPPVHRRHLVGQLPIRVSRET